MTSRQPDPEAQRRAQYRDASNLDVRAALHEAFSTNPQGWCAWVFAQMALADDARVLEVGCGPGFLWSGNASRLAPTWRVCLSDLSMGMLREARRRLAHHLPWFFARLEAQAIPFPAGCFDAVVANHMLYHVPDVERALAEIRRVLLPGGVLFAATNGDGHMLELARLVGAARLEQHDETAKAIAGSIQGFDLTGGARLLRKWFPRIEVRPYPDALEVTDGEAIVRYVQSSPTLRLDAAGVARLRELIAGELARRGAISITKQAALLIGWCRSGD